MEMEDCLTKSPKAVWLTTYAAALALTGWYLMVPPSRTHVIAVNSPEPRMSFRVESAARRIPNVVPDLPYAHRSPEDSSGARAEA
jgi:hypothetical protein